MMNEQKGNMYGFVTHTWNPIKGKCSHDCEYCYMKVWKQKPLRLVDKELEDDLGEGNFIFVGSSTDMFAWTVPTEWILKVLRHCKRYENNKFLFQSKNPARFTKFYGEFPDNVVFATTIETNRDLGYDGVPDPWERAFALRSVHRDGGDCMVTIEPIMDFDIQELLDMVMSISPKWINIGADSKGHNLPEPSSEKINNLINELKKFAEVKIKDNLLRLTIKK